VRSLFQFLDGTAPKYQSRYLVRHILATAYELCLRGWTFRIRWVVLGFHLGEENVLRYRESKVSEGL
jgi:hypothetical protein